MSKKLNTCAQTFGNKTSKKSESPFGYFGSKRRIAHQILEDLPPHSAWVELFCGSAALTLAKEPAEIEIINDLDGRIVNFFRILRTRHKELCRRVALTPYAREELAEAKKEQKGVSKIERARLFLVESMMSMNGIVGQEAGGFSCSSSYSRNGREARVNRWYNLPDKLATVVERLRSVRVENRDARKLFGEFIDKPGTLVYLDPPYLADRTNGYMLEANDEEFHRDLLHLANKAKCMVFISGYDHKLYRDNLTKAKGWVKRKIQTSTRDSSGQDHVRVEIIWMNRHFVQAQKNQRVRLRLSEKERDYNKVNPSR